MSELCGGGVFGVQRYLVHPFASHPGEEMVIFDGDDVLLVRQVRAVVVIRWGELICLS